MAMLALAGCLQHVSRAYMRGFACDPTAPNSGVEVAFYATDVAPQGGGTCRQGPAPANETICFVGRITADGHADPVEPNSGVTIAGAACTPGPANPTCYGPLVTNRGFGGSVVASSCGGSATHGFQFPTPKVLLDQTSRRVYAYSKAVNGTESLLAGSPFTFDPNVAYRQESIFDLDQHTHWQGNGHFGFVHPELNQDYKHSLFDRTLLTFWGQTNPTTGNGMNPVALPVTQSLAFWTGFSPANPPSVAQRSFDGSTLAGVQAQGTRTGILLHPRARVATDKAFNDGMIALVNLDKPLNVWGVDEKGRDGQHDKIRVTGYFKQPLGVGSGTGNAFLYYTMQFQHRSAFDRSALPGQCAVDPVGCDPRHPPNTRALWFASRFYQYQWVPGDPGLSSSEGFAIDYLASPSNPIGALDSIISPSSQRIDATSCGSTSMVTGVVNTQTSAEHKVCFDVSKAQFDANLASLNAQATAYDASQFQQGDCYEDGNPNPEHGNPGGYIYCVNAKLGKNIQHFQTYPGNGADYLLSHFNVNAEAWSPPGTLAWMGASWRDVEVSIQRHNYPPYGYVGLQPNNNTLNGWLCDADDYPRSLDVHFYATNVSDMVPATSCGTIGGDYVCIIGGVTANIQRNDVRDAPSNPCGHTAMHGFDWTLPSWVIQLNRTHKIYSQGINYPSGNNPTLFNNASLPQPIIRIP